MTAPSPKDTDAHAVWTTPVALCVLMSAGLIAALIGDGPWDALACFVLLGIASYAALFVLASRER